MNDTVSRFHVLLATSDEIPWEDDVTAHDAQHALELALADFRAAHPESSSVTHVLVRREPSNHG